MITMLGTMLAGSARFAIKIIITVFTWATVYFYGRFPVKRQLKMTVVSLLSVLWLLFLVRSFVPFFDDVIYGEIPDEIRGHAVVRKFDSISVFILPVVIGSVCYFFDESTHDNRIEKFILSGFYYAPMLGLATIAMILESIAHTVYRYARSLKIAHIPMMSRDGDYNMLAQRIVVMLIEKGFPAEKGKPGSYYRLPLLAVEGIMTTLLGRKTNYNQILIKGKDFKIFLHHYDMMLEGKEKTINQLVPLLKDFLSLDKSYMTWEDKAHQIEDQIIGIIQSKSVEADLALIEQQRGLLVDTNLNYHEIEALLRRMNLIEREKALQLLERS